MLGWGAGWPACWGHVLWSGVNQCVETRGPLCVWWAGCVCVHAWCVWCGVWDPSGVGPTEGHATGHSTNQHHHSSITTAAILTSYTAGALPGPPHPSSRSGPQPLSSGSTGSHIQTPVPPHSISHTAATPSALTPRQHGRSLFASPHSEVPAESERSPALSPFRSLPLPLIRGSLSLSRTLGQHPPGIMHTTALLLLCSALGPWHLGTADDGGQGWLRERGASSDDWILSGGSGLPWDRVDFGRRATAPAEHAQKPEGNRL